MMSAPFVLTISSISAVEVPAPQPVASNKNRQAAPVLDKFDFNFILIAMMTMTISFLAVLAGDAL